MIACLGWGSLIWGTGTLPVGDWQCDGPSVRVEFLRQSRNRRLTLVLHASAEPVSSLWAHMTVDSLDNATKATSRPTYSNRSNPWPSAITNVSAKL